MHNKLEEGNYCINLIKEALNKIPDDYYKLGTTYKKKGIVRERVFCYELYHEIRCLQPENHILYLHGEIDKRGHIKFDKDDRKNPDFVFHTPRNMKGNTLICEVKGIINNNSDILKDFKTIITFIEKYDYCAGVFILYNYRMDDLKKYLEDKDWTSHMEKEGIDINLDTFNKITILTKFNKNNKLEENKLIDFINQNL